MNEAQINDMFDKIDAVKTYRDARDYLRQRRSSEDVTTPDEREDVRIWRKVAEGPELEGQDRMEIIDEIKNRYMALSGAKDSNNQDFTERRLKINRILSELEKVYTETGEDIEALWPQIKNYAYGPLDDWTRKKKFDDLVSGIRDYIDRTKNNDQLRSLDNRHLLLKALDEVDYQNTYAGYIQRTQEELRNLGEGRGTPLRVAAHRGEGPTFKEFGGTILPADQRTARPPENTMKAYNLTLDQVISKNALGNAAGMDGIECDVYLSRDNIPMISHDEYIWGQIQPRGSARPLGDTRREIHEYTAAELKRISKGPGEETNFISLMDLMENVKDDANTYYQLTGEPMRFEVELKGFKKKPGVSEDSYNNLVMRTINRFLKNNPSIPLEVVAFNTTRDFMEKVEGKRDTKTRTGPVRIGVSPSKDDVREDRRGSPGGVPGTSYPGEELRLQFHKLTSNQRRGELGLPALREYDNAGKTVTLIAGQEFLPQSLLPAGGENIIYPKEPSIPPSYAGRSGPGSNVQSDIDARRAGRYTTTDHNDFQLFSEIALRGPLRFTTLLTNYPVKGMWLKSLLADAQAAHGSLQSGFSPRNMNGWLRSEFNKAAGKARDIVYTNIPQFANELTAPPRPTARGASANPRNAAAGAGPGASAAAGKTRGQARQRRNEPNTRQLTQTFMKTLDADIASDAGKDDRKIRRDMDSASNDSQPPADAAEGGEFKKKKKKKKRH